MARPKSKTKKILFAVEIVVLLLFIGGLYVYGQLNSKLDKINRSQIAKQVKLVKQGLGVDKDTIVIPFSAETKQGREEIYALIDQLTGKEEVTQ